MNWCSSLKFVFGLYFLTYHKIFFHMSRKNQENFSLVFLWGLVLQVLSESEMSRPFFLLLRINFWLTFNIVKKFILYGGIRNWHIWKQRQKFIKPHEMKFTVASAIVINKIVYSQHTLCIINSFAWEESKYVMRCTI